MSGQIVEVHLEENLDGKHKDLRKMMARRDLIDNVIYNIVNTVGERHNHICGRGEYKYSTYSDKPDDVHRIEMQDELNQSPHTEYLFRLFGLNTYYGEQKMWRKSGTKEAFERKLEEKLESYLLSGDEEKAKKVYGLLEESLATPYADREPSVPKRPVLEMDEWDWEANKGKYLKANGER